MEHGPTSANCSPARVIFVRSEEGKAAIAAPYGGNQKTKSAAVCDYRPMVNL